MSVALLLAVLVFSAEPRAAASGREEAADRGRHEAPASATKVKVGDADVRRLVGQLASESYQEREAATRALRALAELALPALKKAAGSNDPEVRWRASKTIRTIEEEARARQIEVIKNSKLSAYEKGRRLKRFILVGMRKKVIVDILGQPSSSFGINFVERYDYKDYSLRLVFKIPPSDRYSRVWDVELVPPQ